MRLLRRLVLTLAALALLAIAVALVFWIDLGRELSTTVAARQAQLQALRGKTSPRDVHAPPTLPGTFAALAKPSFDWLAQHAAQIRTAEAGCTDPAHPAQRLSAAEKRLEAPLPPGCETFRQAGWEGVSGLLRATHAEAGATPAVLDLGPSAPSSPWLLDAAWIATIQIVQRLDAHQPDESLRVCEDLLALARDLANGSGLLGLGLESAVVDLAFSPCSLARNAATPAAQAEFRTAVDRILKSLPPLSDTFREEGIAETLAAAPASGRLIQAVEARDEALRRDRTFLALAAGADLSPSDRRAVFKTIQAQAAQSWNPLAAIASPDWESWAERADDARAELRSLRDTVPGSPRATGAAP